MEIDFQKRNYFSRRYMFMAGIRMRIKNKNKYKLRMKEQEENSGEKNNNKMRLWILHNFNYIFIRSFNITRV